MEDEVRLVMCDIFQVAGETEGCSRCDAVVMLLQHVMLLHGAGPNCHDPVSLGLRVKGLGLRV